MRPLRRLLPLALALPLAAQAPVTRLDDLQVTATRTPSPLARVPAAVTVLQGDDLRRQGLIFLADALREVPGASVVQNGSYGAVQSLFLRGGESDYVKVLVDGVPLNNPGGSLNLANLPLDDVERIEIVRGPVSVLHGSDAMSGVIQVFTRRGGERPAGDLAWRGGTLGNSDLRGRVAAATGRWRASLAGSRFASDGSYPFNNDYLNANGSLRLDWDGGDAGTVTLNARYGDALAHFPTDGAGVPVDRNQRVLDRDLLLGMRASRPLGERFVATADAWMHRLDSRFRDPQDDAADTTGFGFASNRDGVLVRRGAGARLDWRAARSVTLTGGAGLERETEEQQGTTLSDFGFGREEQRGDFTARRVTRHGYLQVLANPSDRVSVQAGARLDDNTAFGGFATWRAGAVWRPLPGWRLWSAVGTGFKAPTFSELFAAGAYEVGNPLLDPERSRSAEFGIQRTAGRTSLGVTAFHQRFRDLIQYLAAAPGEPTYGNLGGARARGLEATAALTVSDQLSLQGRFTWLSTAVTDSGSASSVAFRQGAPLLRRPSLSGGATVLASGLGARAAATVTWVGEREDADFRDFPATRITLPSYATVDLALEAPVTMTAGGPAAVLLLRVENLFNASWEQAVGFPGRGRVLFAGGRLSL